MYASSLSVVSTVSCPALDDAITFEAQQQQKAEKAQKSEMMKGITLVFCFFGLQGSYLTWGVLQEKIMTRTYTDSAGNEGQFKDSQFLVFVNRILAFAIALLYITVSRYSILNVLSKGFTL